MHHLEKYWMFATFCVTIIILLVRLVLRERITLQSSLAYMLFLAVLSAFVAFPSAAEIVSRAMGFTLLSNFFFAVIAGMFALLHLIGLISHSKAELRTAALVQEQAILQEKLDAILLEGRNVAVDRGSLRSVVGPTQPSLPRTQI